MSNLKELYPGINPSDRVIFIGIDTRETMAYLVAKHSIEKRSPGVKVLPLYTKSLRQVGVYSRPTLIEGNTGQYIDVTENRPHSVDFSFTRFLVPYIARQLGLTGYVMFADCDFLFRCDMNHLFDELNTNYRDRPLAVVKHNFGTTTEVKMDGCLQLKYSKKLWSAFMCFNMQSPEVDVLTPEVVNKVDGMYLHGFKWLASEDSIVGLPEVYQYIPDHSEKNTDQVPKIIHYTERAPWFHGEMSKTSWSHSWWSEVEDWKKSVVATPRYTRLWE